MAGSHRWSRQALLITTNRARCLGVRLFRATPRPGDATGRQFVTKTPDRCQAHREPDPPTPPTLRDGTVPQHPQHHQSGTYGALLLDVWVVSIRRPAITLRLLERVAPRCPDDHGTSLPLESVALDFVDCPIATRSLERVTAGDRTWTATMPSSIAPGRPYCIPFQDVSATGVEVIVSD